MALSPRSQRTVSAPRRSPGKWSPVRGTPRLADLAEDDKEKIALIVKQFSEACRHRDELADVVKEQESQVHHLIRERWLFTQENTRLAKEVENLRQKLREVEESQNEHVSELRDKMKKICLANKQLSEICTEQKHRLAKQHTKAEEMDSRYQTMVSAMKCLELKLENSKKSIRKLRYHLDNARNARTFPARTAEGSVQTEPAPVGTGTACRCCGAPPSYSNAVRPCPLTSSGPLSQPPATRQVSEVSTGPVSQSVDTVQPPPAADGAVTAARPQPGQTCSEPAGCQPHGTASQVTCQGSAASRWTLPGAACPPAPPGGGGGLLEWAAAEPAGCPCWHQVSPAGQLALSPQAVEDWMLTKLFFSGRAPCSVAHVQLQ
ncbi:uncharacterized protein LOC122393444 [Amphibalanus amphitrite]|uniref:uncharacterized protein LOC122370173 n=1 Tax=Amphibalanus amphitrite TaxID=1232801 RepID=UPI001C8FF7E2|nr:uncharacterized protein LOC122370173 [Amphibalanus amphitrite]XP_043245396.1 uncharacterized protein LOC122393444 [Amphibalanus amphitrite]